MKQIKRSLAILLAVLLTLSCCPVSVLAAEDDPAPEGVVVEQTEASVETEETAAEPESDGAAEAEEISALDTGDYFEAVAQVTIGGETGAYDDIYTAIEALADAEEADAACLQLLADVEDGNRSLFRRIHIGSEWSCAVR